MPSSILSEYEIFTLNEIVNKGVTYMSGRDFAELTMISHRYGANALSRDYHQIRVKLVDGRWYGISDDELKLYAMELLRLNDA